MKPFLQPLLTKPIIHQKDIVAMTTKEATGIKVNPKQDKHLRRFLKISAQKLRAEIPTPKSSSLDGIYETSSKELAFLEKTVQLISKQCTRKTHTHEEIMVQLNQDQRTEYENKLNHWIKNGQGNPPPRYQKTRLLGDSMKTGFTVCNHKATINKLLLDKLDVEGLKTELQLGIMKPRPLEGGKFYQNSTVHAWTVVEMPSKQKYIVDPQNQLVIQLTEKLEDGSLALCKGLNFEENLKKAYISFDDLITHGNPDFLGHDNRDFSIHQHKAVLNELKSSKRPIGLNRLC